MPIDPTAQAASPLISQRELTPAEKQNQYGMKRQYISDLTPGKFLTLLAVQTPVALTPMQYADVEKKLKVFFGVESMQTAFAAEIPNFGPNYRNDLHLQAHLRAERKFDDIAPSEPVEAACPEAAPEPVTETLGEANHPEETPTTEPAAGDPTPSVDLV